MDPRMHPEISWMLALLLSPSRDSVQPPLDTLLIIRKLFIHHLDSFCIALVSSCYAHLSGDYYAATQEDDRALLLIAQVKQLLGTGRTRSDFNTSWRSLLTLTRALYMHNHGGGGAGNYELAQWLGQTTQGTAVVLKDWLFELVEESVQLSRLPHVKNSLTLRNALIALNHLLPNSDSSQVGLPPRYIDIFRSLLSRHDSAKLFVDIFLWPGGRHGASVAYAGLGKAYQMKALFKDIPGGEPHTSSQ